MKNKLFHLLLVIVASIGTICASDKEVNGIWYDFDDEKQTATVTYKGATIEEKDKNAYSGEIIIPESVTFNGKQYVVSRIGVSAFAESEISGVVLPNTISEIGQSAFGNCAKLTAVSIPQSVSSIALQAFYESGMYNNATNWENDVLYIDDCLICVKPNTFLEGIYTVKEGTRLLADYALIGQYHLTEIIIPESVEYIGEFAFQDCHGLTSLIISDNVKEIRKQAFFSCRNLESLTMSDAVTSIGELAFAECWKLNISVLPKHVRHIGKEAFMNCHAMPSLLLPDSLRTIGERAFKSCLGIAGKVIIPDSVIYVGDYAFEGCSEIKEVTIGESVKTCKNAFNYCTKLKALHFNARHMEESQFYLGYNDEKKQITTLTFGEKVEYLPKQIFYGYSGITELLFPNSLKEIGEMAFGECAALKKVTMGDNIATIRKFAFASCSNLQTIKLPKHVKHIEDFSFSSCAITEIIIPEELEIIGNAFQLCEKLTHIIWEAKHCIQTPTYYSPFLGCKNVESFICGDKVESLSNYLCANMEKLKTVKFSPLITTIESATFENCPEITELTFPASIKSINMGAFYKSTKIQQMTLYATTPPSITLTTFADELKKFMNNIPVYVPAKSYEAYIKHDIWKYFNIIGSSELDTAVDEISTINSQFSTKIVLDGQLFILRDGEIYNAQGAKVE